VKIEQFAECFPRNIGMTDLDGVVELNERFLALEWKNGEYGGTIPAGQSIMFERLANSGLWTVFYVYGDAEAMNVNGAVVITKEHRSERPGVDIVWLKRQFRAWARFTQTQFEVAA
jgi:hypothetical protein